MRPSFRLVCILPVVLLAACGSKPKPDPNIAACPDKTVVIVRQNQVFFNSVIEGETSAKPLKSMKGMQRRATLEKSGESLELGFFVTGLPKCGWMPKHESLTPVVVKDGVIVAGSSQTLTEMIHDGWVIKEAKWPWHNYAYGYLPRK